MQHAFVLAFGKDDAAMRLAGRFEHRRMSSADLNTEPSSRSR